MWKGPMGRGNMICLKKLKGSLCGWREGKLGTIRRHWVALKRIVTPDKLTLRANETYDRCHMSDIWHTTSDIWSAINEFSYGIMNDLCSEQIRVPISSLCLPTCGLGILVGLAK